MRFRPLHLAIEQRNIACVTDLLESNANIEAPTKYKQRPLHIAAEKSQFQIFKALLNRGANIKARDCSVGDL